MPEPGTGPRTGGWETLLYISWYSSVKQQGINTSGSHSITDSSMKPTLNKIKGGSSNRKLPAMSLVRLDSQAGYSFMVV